MQKRNETAAFTGGASVTEQIERKLFEYQDEKYRAFQARLMPGVDPERIIGVRTPVLRKLAKEYAKRAEIGAFLSDLPHRYYDENNLHGFIISEEKDFDTAVREADALLPCVDNWATCDLLSPKAFRKKRERLKDEIERWLCSDRPFTVRFGIEMIQTHYLDEDFDPSFLPRVAGIRSGEYYVNMMIAWFFATALAKRWDAAVPFVEQGALDRWTHNKTIQKAIESDRITPEQKEYLRGLKRKESP